MTESNSAPKLGSVQTGAGSACQSGSRTPANLAGRVYLAGPMRGKPGCNFAAFDLAKQRWTEEGWHVISPADLDRVLGHEPAPDGKFLGEDEAGPAHLVHTMFALLACVGRADAIALLPGWQHSAGATMELAAALFLGLPVYCAETMGNLTVAEKPWAFAAPRGCAV